MAAKQKKRVPEDGDHEDLGAAGDADGEGGEEEDDVARVADRGAEADEGHGPENAEAAGHVVADGHDHDADDDGGEDQGVEKGAGVGEPLVGPAVDVGQDQPQNEGDAEGIKRLQRLQGAGGTKGVEKRVKF